MPMAWSMKIAPYAVPMALGPKYSRVSSAYIGMTAPYEPPKRTAST
jgi:hypothetical protein